MEERTFHPLDYLAALRRRKWWLIVPLVGAIGVGAALVVLLPKTYEASATIGITAPDVSADFVKPATTLDPAERVRVLSQQLKGRRVLERVVREEGLNTGRSTDSAVTSLMRRIKVTIPEAAVRTEDPSRFDSFIVTYTDGTPERAKRIANKIAEVFVEENSRQRTARAEETAAFLSQQLQESQLRLQTLDEKLRRAKETHMGSLPEQTGANLQMVAGLRQQLESTATSLRGEQDRLSMIERQLEFLRSSPLAVPPTPGGGEAPRPAAARAAQIQHELNQARAMYTEKHPEIQRLEEELASAKAAAKAEARAATAAPTAERTAVLQADPNYRQLVADRDMARIRITQLQQSDAQIRGQIAAYQGRVESAPLVDQQLTSLQREYELEKANYASLMGRHKEAVLAEALERTRGNEQFAILYPAALPFRPASPNQVRLMLIATLGGLFLGAGLAVGREYLDRSVHDARALQQEFELPVLGEIPRIVLARS